MAPPIIVLDTNIFVPGLAALQATPARKTAIASLLLSSREKGCILAVSEELLAEYADVCQRAPFNLSAKKAGVAMEALRRTARVVVPDIRPVLTRDPDDNVVLFTAVALIRQLCGTEKDDQINLRNLKGMWMAATTVGRSQVADKLSSGAHHELVMAACLSPRVLEEVLQRLPQASAPWSILYPPKTSPPANLSSKSPYDEALRYVSSVTHDPDGTPRPTEMQRLSYLGRILGCPVPKPTYGQSNSRR